MGGTRLGQVVVLPFVERPGGADLDALAEDLSRRLITTLAANPAFAVDRRRGGALDTGQGRNSPYIVRGGVHRDEGQLRSMWSSPKRPPVSSSGPASSRGRPTKAPAAQTGPYT